MNDSTVTTVTVVDGENTTHILHITNCTHAAGDLSIAIIHQIAEVRLYDVIRKLNNGQVIVFISSLRIMNVH